MAVTRLEIDLGALRHNYLYIRSKIADNVKVIAVVKAFAYGSDAAAISLELEKQGVDYFAVAYVPEGIALRDAGIRTPIMVLHPQPDYFEEMVDRCLEPNLYSKRILELFYAFAKAKNQKNYPVHLKFNTGLNRLGFSAKDCTWILGRLHKNTSLRVKSLFSHLVASEDPTAEEFSLNQILEFTQISKQMIEGLDNVPFLHMTNTSGIINYERAHFDYVRTGIGLYGYGNTPEESAHLMPVARLKSVISQLHTIQEGDNVGYNRVFTAPQEMIIATLPIGHADGISRAFGNGAGYVRIGGVKAPIVGNVCMDMIMVDVTNISCEEGDDVEIFGELTGAEELSSQMKSISYEVLTAISQRVKRVIVD
ncbi:alanine racemase [Dokdonia sp. Hel_I_53]|uniref:alanine racemase n=1 Tax=Dokdonia sp. Hel_I_53 TaxID=1566287 RepID=UPI00119B6902|nr:alanine racemase [Dokdonia sp. Hel_I_53]TVZ52790.1 alanine racemase [Dokdonia sp. Hel_I_53]